jgi:PAS domain S-box-containing protein
VRFPWMVVPWAASVAALGYALRVDWTGGPDLSLRHRALVLMLAALSLAVAGTWMLVWDVARRKQVAEARNSCTLFEQLVQTCDDFVWECDANATYTYASPRSREILGCDPAEVVGLTLFDLMPEGDPTHRRAELASHLEGRKPFRMTKTNVRRRSDPVVLETTATPLFSEDGAFRGYCGIDRDVTEREQDRDQLSRLATAIEAAGDAIIITDRGGVIEYVNPAFERMTGYCQLEAVGGTPRILKSGRQPASVYEHLWSNLGRGVRWNGHFVNKRKDGSFYDAEVTISPIRSKDETISGFVAVQRDVTDHVALLDRLRSAEEMERLGRLVGGVAHEVRNPLNAIQVATATLELEFAGSEDVKALFDIVHAQVERLTKLMRDLLEFGKPVLNTDRFSVAALCLEALLVWRGSHMENAGRVRFDLQDGFDVDVRVDSVRMQQVIINLLDNALQHSPPDGQIVLNCGLDGKYARIVVADFGTGLEPEFASRIFEPFFTRRRGGTGLGLSLVKNVTERHGGHVVVRNREGGPGVVAEVFLPVESNATEMVTA